MKKQGTNLVPSLWYEDNNMARAAGMPSDFKEKFLNPETWEKAREAMDVYMIRANTLTKKENEIDDVFLKDTTLPLLKESNTALALDVQGATWMTHDKKKSVLEQEAALCEKIRNLGGEVTYLSLQSVLSKPLRTKNESLPYPMDQRIEDIVEYTRTMKKSFPEIRVGIIDALPSHGKDYRTPYADLVAALRQSGYELNHIHLDIPFETPEEGINGMSWEKVKGVEVFVQKEIGCEFGLICTSRKAGYESNRAYHETVLNALERHKSVGGAPDQYLIMSWFPHPSRSIPENALENEFPTMKTVLEFYKKI